MQHRVLAALRSLPSMHGRSVGCSAHNRSLMRSPRSPRNANTAPENGSLPSAPCASAASPSNPLRISVSPVPPTTAGNANFEPISPHSTLVVPMLWLHDTLMWGPAFFPTTCAAAVRCKAGAIALRAG